MTANDFLAPARIECSDCGTHFDGIKGWLDLPWNYCSVCSDKAYTARLAVINADRPYRVVEIGGSCPTQAQGETPDGRPFYFRARHGDYDVEVGGWGDPVGEYLLWRTYLTVDSGDDPTGGCMEDDAVLAILDRVLVAL